MTAGPVTPGARVVVLRVGGMIFAQVVEEGRLELRDLRAERVDAPRLAREATALVVHEVLVELRGDLVCSAFEGLAI